MVALLGAVFLSRYHLTFHVDVYSSHWKSFKSSLKINLTLMSSYVGLPWAGMKSHEEDFDLSNGHCTGVFDPSL